MSRNLKYGDISCVPAPSWSSDPSQAPFVCFYCSHYEAKLSLHPCAQLCIAVHCCALMLHCWASLSISEHLCASLCIPVHPCASLCIAGHLWALLWIAVHRCCTTVYLCAPLCIVAGLPVPDITYPLRRISKSRAPVPIHIKVYTSTYHSRLSISNLKLAFCFLPQCLVHAPERRGREAAPGT